MNICVWVKKSRGWTVVVSADDECMFCVVTCHVLCGYMACFVHSAGMQARFFLLFLGGLKMEYNIWKKRIGGS